MSCRFSKMQCDGITDKYIINNILHVYHHYAIFKHSELIQIHIQELELISKSQLQGQSTKLHHRSTTTCSDHVSEVSLKPDIHIF